MNTTITVSIGRNVGDTPMSTPQWEQFKRDLYDTVHSNTQTVILFHGQGTGVWEDTAEDAYTVVATTAHAHRLYNLEFNLTHLAATYHQEAIAVTYGTTELLTP